MSRARKQWMDRTRPLWRIGNKMEAFELRHLGFSLMSLLNSGDVMALETVGRRTGKRRFAPVGYRTEHDGVFIVGGGAAGMATIPDWVKNLRTNRCAAAWIRGSRVAVEAHELTGTDRDRAQQEAAKIWAGIPKYAARSGRIIPYFRLVRLDHP